MELKRGYKVTGAGVVPEDWAVVPLGEEVRITSGESPSQFHFADSGVPYFKVEQLSNSEKYLDSFSTPYHFALGKTVPRGSVVFAKRGAAIALNKVRVLAQDSFMDTNLMALSPNGELDSEFLFYGLGHIGLWRFADTTSVPQINNKHVRPLAFPLPKRGEQRAIATALSDVDALLGALDRLIAKKRDLKQAAMQQLLTGQIRLPGFSGEWEVKRLGDHLAFLKNGVNSRAELTAEGQVKYLHYGDIHGAAGLLLSPTVTPMPHLSISKASRLDRLSDGDLVFADASEDLDGVGKSVELHGVKQTDVVSGLHTIAVRFDKDVLADGFKAYLQFIPVFRQHLRRLTAGTKVYATNRAHIASVEMKLPTATEQTAIAAVLSDMDAEIEALKTRRTKTRDLKQAMMQELLTGKTRLVKPEAAHA